MKSTSLFKFPFLALAFVIFSCSEDADNGLNSLINIEDEPMGSNCPAGGIRVSSGLDANGNGTLEDDEMTQTKFLCDGINGQISNNETRITLEFNSCSVCEIGDGRLLPTQLINFNIANYAADSIALIAGLDPNSAGATISLQLHDLTNNNPIDGALIQHTATSSDTVFVMSNSNFIQSLPSSPIDIGISIDKTNGDYTVGFVSLILFRKD